MKRLSQGERLLGLGLIGEALLPLVFLGCRSMDSNSYSCFKQHGISKELAESRARRVREPRYQISLRLEEAGKDGKAQLVSGTLRLRFTLEEDEAGQADLLLDFAGEDLGEVRLNGRELESLDRCEDHLVLPGSFLRPGDNLCDLRFHALAAAAGSPLNLYHDAKEGESFLYTLTVPSDAHRIYPCFDQPDLRGRFVLRLDLPEAWTAVSNERLTGEKREQGRHTLTFGETPPLPTYLFAFAAGPFAVREKDGMRVFHRRQKTSRLDPLLFTLHSEARQFQEGFFGHPYPFAKLDFVLLPAFPYGGMEHAGAIFYRESALVFDHEPDPLETLRRRLLIYHEVAHQWFGNLVTMKWFDDLWLKEGFATFAAWKTLEHTHPETLAWKLFFERTLPPALRVDRSKGTRPIYQALANLDQAKSNYGPIVYNKAPAVLRLLEQYCGEAAFQKGLGAFLEAQAFGSATHEELLESLGQASQKDLRPFAASWLHSKGAPTLQATLLSKKSPPKGDSHLLLRQTGPAAPWPMRVRLQIATSGDIHSWLVDLSKGESLISLPFPLEEILWVLPNPDAAVYAQVLLDPRTLTWAQKGLSQIQDPLQRATFLSALFHSGRKGLISPLELAKTLIPLLEREQDPQSLTNLLGMVGTTLRRWAPKTPETATLQSQVESLLRATLLQKGSSPSARPRFLAFCKWAKDESSLALLEALLEGKTKLPSLSLSIQDKSLALAALLAHRRPGAERLLAKLSSQSKQDISRYLYLAQAARPGLSHKKALFDSWFQKDAPPEQWIQDALPFYHWPGQAKDSLPLLRSALDRALWIRKHRKIFFLPAWFDTWLGAQRSEEALPICDAFLRDHPKLPKDIRDKLEVPLAELRRTMKR